MENKTKTKISECNKLTAVKSQSATLSEFVDWLEENGMRICKMVDCEVAPYEAIMETNEKLFARFFDIDLDKLEEERQNLLKACRHVNRMDDEKKLNSDEES